MKTNRCQLQDLHRKLFSKKKKNKVSKHINMIKSL